MNDKKLERDFFTQPTLQVARKLLGKYLVLKQNGTMLSGKIVETEAYIGKNDPASHAFGRITPRNQIMYGPPGFAYIYFIYGNYFCLNFVTEEKGFPAAVLIRALEPSDGIEKMSKNRNSVAPENLTNGPGKLCQAFGIDKNLNGCDITSNSLFVEDRNETVDQIESSNRIGVREGNDKKWRFYIAKNSYVSKIRS